jgi:glycosyltransferase involved in cell wall biosynthesis
MIVFDIQAVQSIEHGERGIARYTGELARALQANHPKLVDVFAYNDALPYVPRLDALGLNGKLRSFRELRGQRVDLLHVNSPFEQPSIGALATPVIAERTVVTCYDLIPYRFSDIYLPDAGAKAWYQSRLGMLVSADAIVTDSQSAADDVIRMLSVDARVVTSIGAGTAEQFVPPTDTLADRMVELNKVVPALLPGFVMVPAGPEWRKNLDGAVEAYSRLDPVLRQRHQLVIASKIADGQRATFFDYCRERGVADDVVVTGFVSDADLVRLYQSAEVVLFPSKYEGFGLPVLEARRCGARVITSNVSSLPEVMPEAAALFNPYDMDDIAAKLLAALTDVDIITALDGATDPGFTWERAADTLADVYAEVIGRPSLPSGHACRQIALAAPLPLQGPELSRRTLALAAQLETETESDVTIFVQADAPRLAEDWGRNVQNLRILPAQQAAGEYDAVLCVLGDKAIENAFAAIAQIVPAQLAVWPDDDELSQQASALVDLLGPAVEVGQLAASIARREPIGG